MTVALAVLAVTILIDVFGQIAFKVGLDGGRGSERPLWLRVLTAPLIWLGVAAYAVELAAWLFVLSRLPLSLAYPLASLSYCGIALASRAILKEPVSPRRWLGTGLIAAGAAIVGASA
jgi:undecaprenyl phosphate-alpha-L-ara4N flippase subunit ArnE